MTELGNVSIKDISPALFGIDNTVVLIYTYVVFTALCQFINIFGIVTNIINIICFFKQGFKDPINVSFLGLSVSDLCNLISMTFACIFLTPAFNALDLPFDIQDVTYLVLGMTHVSFSRVSSCITAMITMERCLSIVAPLKVKNIISSRRITVAIACIFLIFTFSCTPVFVVNRLGIKFSLSRNKTLIGLVSRHDKDDVEKVTFLINNFLIPVGAFVIVAFTTVVLSTQLRKKAEWRKTIITDSQAERISGRNLKVAKMVVTISTLFIVCFIPTTVVMLAMAFEPAMSFNGKYVNISFILFGFTYLMEEINSSMNVFIYHHMSSKYRETFRKLFC